MHRGTLPVTLLVLITLTLASLSPLPCTRASDHGKPIVIPIVMDKITSLYTIPIKDGSHRSLVLDLAGTLIWHTCESTSHPTVELHQRECVAANRSTPPTCWAHSYHDSNSFASRKKCTARPYNPMTGTCAAGELTRSQLAANATDGRNPLHPVSFFVVSSCASKALLESLPPGAVGVAGLPRAELTLPALVASTRNAAKAFVLCLPSSGGAGVAVFGGGPFYLIPRHGVPEPRTPLLRNLPAGGRSQGYFFMANGFSLNRQPLPLGKNVNEIAVELSTTTPYTALRPVLYRGVVRAFDVATTGYARVTPSVAPFKLCYDQQNLTVTRVGYNMPLIHLESEGGAVWTMSEGC